MSRKSGKHWVIQPRNNNTSGSSFAFGILQPAPPPQLQWGREEAPPPPLLARKSSSSIPLVPQADDIDAAFTCSVCLDYYKTPKNLPNCGHCYCLACLETLQKGDFFSGIKVITCPDCRSTNTLSPGGTCDLKTNVQLQKGAETMKKLQSATTEPLIKSLGKVASLADKCPHQRLQNTTICQHCNNAFCNKCQVSHMELMKIEILSQKELQKRVETSLDGLDEKVAAIKSAVDENIRQVELEITDARCALETRVKDSIAEKYAALLSELGSIGKEQMGKVTDLVENVRNKCDQDAEIVAETEKLSTKSVMHCQLDEIAKLHKLVSDRDEEVAALEKLKEAEINSFFGKISFQPDKKLENEMLEEVVAQNFGTIFKE